MISVRPATSPHYIARPRLLEALPDQPGFTVWLEAPYGYGKSVLTSQWAAELEDRGWRVIWLSLAYRDPRITLAQALELPAATPWAVLLDELWTAPTVVVLEDLEGHEDLEPLLRQNGGLILLASRRPLPYPSLPQLLTAGRLLHLTADRLAFTEAEARSLFSDPLLVANAWRTTNGWPLPLHFAALSSTFPSNETLLDGVRRSVSPAAWRELQFMASLDQLPSQAATKATQELVSSGFVQELTGGLRLHPMVASGMFEVHGPEVRQALGENAARLPPELQGAAFERVGHSMALNELLSANPQGVLHRLPEEFVRWHELTPPSDSWPRLAHATQARLLLNRFGEALPDATRLLDQKQLPAADRARLAAVAVFALGGAKRFEQAAPFAHALQALAPHCSLQVRADAWRSLGYLAFMQGNTAQAVRFFRDSLELLKESAPSPDRTALQAKITVNITFGRWEADGDVEESLHELQELLVSGGLDDNQLTIIKQNAAFRLAILSRTDEAIALTQDALSLAPIHQRVTIEAMLAFLRLDLEPFPRLLATARKWEQNEQSERVSALWLRALRFRGDLSTGAHLQGTLPAGPYTDLELAWVAAAGGQGSLATELIDKNRDAYHYREFRLHWHAADYALNGKPSSLEALLALTPLHERILPYVGIRLTHLPRSRPQLARPYPLGEVLVSGWSQAIQLRLPEVPPLRLSLLGEVSATLLGQAVALTERQQQLLALLALGHNRDAIGEAMWPETDEARQRNNLGVQLNGLRRLLEPWGVTTYLHKEGLRHTVTDVQQLFRALEQGDADTALSTYRGQFCHGLTLDLLLDTGRQLHQRCVSLLFTAAAGTDGDRALAYLKRVLELDPLHEESVQRLIRLLNERGRGHESRQLFGRFKRSLAEETGLSPSAATLALLSDTAAVPSHADQGN